MSRSNPQQCQSWTFRPAARPISAAPIDSDPPEVEITVARGDSIAIDFSVEPGTGPDSLWVRVTDADFQPLTNAVVEVYEERSRAEPVTRSG